MFCKIVCMHIVACSTHKLSHLKHVQSRKWNWGYLKMVSPVFINEAFDFRTFCVMEFLRLFHGPTPLLYVLYLFSSSYFFFQDALRCTKELKYFSVKMPGISKLPSQQKMDAQTYTFIEHFFWAPAFRQFTCLFYSLYIGISILGLFCTGTHSISSQGEKKVMGRCNHNNLSNTACHIP